MSQKVRENVSSRLFLYRNKSGLKRNARFRCQQQPHVALFERYNFQQGFWFVYTSLVVGYILKLYILSLHLLPAHKHLSLDE
jgi:hypothetical protein